MQTTPRLLPSQARFRIDRHSKTFKVIVADDSRVYRKLVEDVLIGKQYQVFFAKNGAEAIELFSEHQPALVITDWMMPDLGGIRLCEHIRSHSRNSYTYIIVVTGVTEKSNVVTALAAGADDYLTKPFYSEELSARVEVGHRIIQLYWQIEANNRFLEELALTDALTGLPNRHAIEEWAPRQLIGAKRHGFSFWVVVSDLDKFKSVNDTYGHEAGDMILKRFGEILIANGRASDISARFGGEEFLIVISHTSRAGVLTAVERIRQQIESERFTFGVKEIAITASFGIAEYDRQRDQTFAQLVARADVAMYSAKRRGRNHVELEASEREQSTT
jgi:two-component system cell cycle response regulator